MRVNLRWVLLTHMLLKPTAISGLPSGGARHWSVMVHNACSFPVYMYVARGSTQSCWTQLSDTLFIDASVNGTSIKLATEKPSPQNRWTPSLTQLEYALGLADNNIYYDVSNQDAYPFPPFSRAGLMVVPLKIDGGMAENCTVISCPGGQDRNATCDMAYTERGEIPSFTYACLAKGTIVSMKLCGTI